MGRVARWILVGVVGVGVLVAGIFFLVFSLTRPVVDASDTFMTALKDGNYPAAYEMTTTDLKAELGSPDRLAQMFARTRPASWSWSSRQIKNSVGNVSGTVTYSAGGESPVSIVLLSEGDAWKVAGFQMNPP